jgi:hypothetical protein
MMFFGDQCCLQDVWLMWLTMKHWIVALSKGFGCFQGCDYKTGDDYSILQWIGFREPGR